MLPLSRPKEKKNGKYDPGMDVKENESPGDETGANAEEAEDPEAGDGAFVSTNGRRKRRSAHAKIVPYALIIGGTAVATGLGVNVAVKRAKITPATAIPEPTTESTKPTVSLKSESQGEAMRWPLT